MQNLQYPKGKFILPSSFNDTDLEQFIITISTFSQKLSDLTATASDALLDTNYRPEGWTIRQVVHHCADSHMNAFIRFKLALTEENPNIKAYEEQLWAAMNDYKMPVESSLSIIKALHQRWVVVLKNMTEADFNKTYFHPQQNRQSTLWNVLALYAWHCEHHLGHVKLVIK